MIVAKFTRVKRDSMSWERQRAARVGVAAAWTQKRKLLFAAPLVAGLGGTFKV